MVRALSCILLAKMVAPGRAREIRGSRNAKRTPSDGQDRGLNKRVILTCPRSLYHLLC